MVLSGEEILAVDPDEVDTAVGDVRLHLTGQLREDVVDVHGNTLERDAILILQFLGYGSVEPFIAILIAAPAIECDGLAICLLEQGVPIGGVERRRGGCGSSGRGLRLASATEKRPGVKAVHPAMPASEMNVRREKSVSFLVSIIPIFLIAVYWSPNQTCIGLCVHRWIRSC